MARTQAPAAERSRLSKKTVVDRGLALADASGLDGLTIRRLAQDLRVTPMALYWHFRSKEELLVALADRVWSEIAADIDPAQPWPRQLRGLLESLVRVLRNHPCASQLLMETEKQSESFLRLTEITLGVLRGGRVTLGLLLEDEPVDVVGESRDGAQRQDWGEPQAGHRGQLRIEFRCRRLAQSCVGDDAGAVAVGQQ